MLPHDELLHYGVRGMRWGVTGKSRYEKAQSRDAAIVEKQHSKADSSRSIGRKTRHERTANQADMRITDRKSVHDFKATNKNTIKEIGKAIKKGQISNSKTVQKYHEEKAAKLRKMAARAEKFGKERHSRYYNKQAKRAEYRAKVSDYEARMMKRNIQKIKGEKVDKLSKEDKKIIFNETLRTVGSIAAITLIVS